ncbi:DNA-binding protein [Lacihabitans sp. LS3-19]|uniref:DNA-binding protein n=1 Tax=Lacihabitans sp. LS3-19 TaxID=2487335 RepID=UPI0020CD3A8C|nr:DNA-binding protein [Lacihabitans sp. LS3-19]MCP9766689.1 DNA-binding protein [Lacihabitans sp. LS3-19]
MTKDLTTSDLHRKNILNNQFALDEIQKEVSFMGVVFKGSFRYTKRQIADFYDVDERTIDRYIENHEDEFRENGYEVLRGNDLKEFKEAFELYTNSINDGNDIDVATIEENIKKISVLGIFTFRVFLNIGMLLTESERAKQLRSLILDIVLDTINKKLGGNTKYINQREEDFLPSAIRENNYRVEFTKAIDECVEHSKWKYPQLTDAVYKCIFHENAKEYKQILKLEKNENLRETLYSEILDLVAAYENSYAELLRQRMKQLGRQLRLSEANQLFKELEEKHFDFSKPLLDRARTLMASRDMAFRDALHEKLKDYITHLNETEFDKFLGEKSKSIQERIEENIDVFKRLKDR